MLDQEMIIMGCLRNDLSAQKLLFDHYFGRVKSICMRYAKDDQEANHMLNRSFKDVFAHIKEFNSNNNNLDRWITQTSIKAAVEILRSNKQEYGIVSTVVAGSGDSELQDIENPEKISQIPLKDLLKALHELSPAFRTVYCLFAIDGFSHKEISELLNISEQTSRFNLSKAEYNLRKNIVKFLSEAR